MMDPAYQIHPSSSSSSNGADTLRQRKPFGTSSNRHPQQHNNSSSTSPLGSRYAAGLRRSQLARAPPSHAGDLFQLKLPPMFAVLPESWQRWLLVSQTAACFRYLFQAILPRWQARHVMIVGKYLYKFVNQNDNLKNNDTPKGRPIPLQSMEIQLLSPDRNPSDFRCISEAKAAVQNLPRPQAQLYHDEPTFQSQQFQSQQSSSQFHILVISTLRKRYYFAMHCSNDDARAWVVALQQARQEALKRDMGHAPDGSAPASLQYYDQLGDALVQHKARTAARLQAHDERELELTTFQMGGGGGAVSGGGMVGMTSGTGGMMDDHYRDDTSGRGVYS